MASSEGRMIEINLKLLGDGVLEGFPEEKIIRIRDPITISTLEGGLKSGRPSLAIIIDLPDGRKVMAETSAKLFIDTAAIVRSRYFEGVPGLLARMLAETGARSELMEAEIQIDYIPKVDTMPGFWISFWWLPDVLAKQLGKQVVRLVEEDPEILRERIADYLMLYGYEPVFKVMEPIRVSASEVINQPTDEENHEDTA